MKENLIKSSFKFCEETAKNHYENFPVASFLIPKEKRKYIYSIYAFARIADDYADELNVEGGKEKRFALLNEWNQKLIDCYNDKVYDPIFIALNQTVKDCNIPIEPLENLLKAFKQDVVKNRYETFDEVLGYCSNSANPVGRLVLLVFGINDKNIFELSDKICTALQLTNFWQDVSVDIEKDRIYIPIKDMNRFTVNIDQILYRKFDENFKNLMKYEVELTTNLFLQGKKLIIYSQKRKDLIEIENELKLTWLGGNAILNKIKKIDYNVLDTRPKLNGFNKLSLLFQSFFKQIY